MEQICILLQDVDRHNDTANHTIKEYDLDGVIEGCIGALHACRNVSCPANPRPYLVILATDDGQ